MIKKGDVVRIKTYDELVKEYGEPDENGNIICGYAYPNEKSSRKLKCYFTPSMQKLCGKLGYVANINNAQTFTLFDARYLDPTYEPDPAEASDGWIFEFSISMVVEMEV